MFCSIEDKLFSLEQNCYILFGRSQVQIPQSAIVKEKSQSTHKNKKKQKNELNKLNKTKTKIETYKKVDAFDETQYSKPRPSCVIFCTQFLSNDFRWPQMFCNPKLYLAIVGYCFDMKLPLFEMLFWSNGEGTKVSHTEQRIRNRLGVALARSPDADC